MSNEQINSPESNHYLISPTAKMVAWMRAQSDIPYSNQIAELTNSKKATQELLGGEGLEWWMGSILEQRYKSLSALVQREAFDKGVKNIFEFASGVLPRGILMTEDPEIHYIETDLPEMIAEKIKLVKELNIDLSKRNLSFRPLNVLDSEELEKLTEHIPEGPICFINEGLMPYLSIPEKEIMSKSIVNILRKRGGLWITPDLSNSSRMREIVDAYPEMQEMLAKIIQSTQRDVRANSFLNFRSMQSFFENLGFSLTEYNQSDLAPELSTLDTNLEEDKKQMVLNILSSSKIWILKLRD